MRIGISLGINRPAFAPGDGGGGNGGGDTSEFTLTVASGTVDSDLADFPTFVRLADMPAEFWSNGDLRSDGGNVRVKTPADALVPIDLVSFDKTAQTGLIVFLAGSVLAASDNEWKVTIESADTTGLANGDANGRFAVWADYHIVGLLGDGFDDHVAGVTPSLLAGTQPHEIDPDEILSWNQTDSLAVNGHQGVCSDGSFYYVFDSNALRKYDLAGTLVASNPDPVSSVTPVGSDFTDGDIYNGVIYVTVGGWVTLWDPSDLSFISEWESTQTTGSGMCINTDTETLVMCSFGQWGGGNNELREHTLDGTFIQSISMDVDVPQPQGLVYYEGHYWIASDSTNTVFKVRSDGTVVATNSASVTGSGNREGVGILDGNLIWLISGTTDTVRTMEPQRAPHGTVAYPVAGRLLWNAGSGAGTQFTYAATLRDGGTAQAAIITANGAVQVKTVVDNGNSLGAWTSADDWFYCSPTVDPGNALIGRVHTIYDGTTARHILFNGANKGTDNSVSSDSPSQISVGDSGSEPWNGEIGFVYLYPGVLSDDWVAAEWANLDDPASFYTVTTP